jgi:2-methylcitrate dehydratase PrpD
MNESRALAEFVSALAYESLPIAVVEKAKSLILDQVGIMRGVATLPWSKVINEYVLDWGSTKQDSTVVHYGYKTKAENAAFANSSFGHGFEIDDLYVYGSSHPGCVVVPTALAMGERQGISGRDFLLAVVAGYEVMGRINSAITPSCALRGFHAPTSISGPFGAAAATGKILGFDPDLMLNALSIAGSHSAGVTEYDQGGGSVKRMHAGMASHGGIRSALIAQKGLTGPSTILEGKHGIFVAFTDAYRPDEITDKLGQEFKVVMGTGFKAYFACFPIQAAIDAMLELKRHHGISAQDVVEITMGTNRRSVTHVAAKPTDILSAQFSAPFSLALTLVRGSNGFQDYTEQTLHDPEILKLANRVKLEVDKEIDSEYPGRRGARVTVKLKGGASHQVKVDHCKGTPQNPMTAQELEDKFRGLASIAASAEQVDEIIRQISTLEQQKDLSKLIAQLSAPKENTQR